jgi:putative hydrolase of the HAD superfamily
MKFRRNLQTIDWSEIKLVVFDVDGTLYDQHALRMRMVRDMLLHTILRQDLGVMSVIKTYRRIRERLGDTEVFDFESHLIAETVATTGFSEEKVLAIVHEWIEQRPLPYLLSCRYPGLTELFAGLKRSGKIIGVFSDYPAHQKLSALNLAADYIASAQDDCIRLLKPHPKGLEFLISKAGFTAAETVLIGDRIERDGIAAQRAGVRCLIRSSKPKQEWQTFVRFDDHLFAPLLSD